MTDQGRQRQLRERDRRQWASDKRADRTARRQASRERIGFIARRAQTEIAHVTAYLAGAPVRPDVARRIAEALESS